MATLEQSFETKLRAALVDDAYQQAIGGRDNFAGQFVRAAHENLREYGARFGYDVEPIISALGQPQVRRRTNGVSVTVGWDHEAAVYMEFGTPRHRVEGRPILSFVWEDPPMWVREEFDQARVSRGSPAGGQFREGWRVFLPEVEVEGLPEGRWIRDALRFLELQLSGRFQQVS